MSERRFYREHKYVIYRLTKLGRLIAQTDFLNPADEALIKGQLNDLKNLLDGHGQHEEENLHPLLESTHSDLIRKLDEHHAQMDASFHSLYELLAQVSAAPNHLKETLNHRFYLKYCHFMGDMILHLHEEETLLMPELIKNCDPKTLAEVEHKVYRIMTTEQLTDMIRELFPHMNSFDKSYFLNDIELVDKNKYINMLKKYALKVV